MLYAHTNHKRFRSILVESLVHCHGGCEFEPRHRTLLFYSILYFYQFRYNCLTIIHNAFQTIYVSVDRFNVSKKAYPIELVHSVTSRVCVLVFANVPFDGHFV